MSYNAYTGSWDYSCSYAGWRGGAKVTYHCKLYDYTYQMGSGYAYRLLADNSGSWTPPPANRSRSYTEYPTVSHGAYCVKATALSVDGGDASPMVCK